jgi:hypothetical protein
MFTTREKLLIAGLFLSKFDRDGLVSLGLRDRYFLFVARHFAEKPFHTIYRNPLACGLSLSRTERTVITVNWTIPITA